MPKPSIPRNRKIMFSRNEAIKEPETAHKIASWPHSSFGLRQSVWILLQKNIHHNAFITW